MIATIYDLILEQQTSFLQVFQWLNSSNVGVDLSSYDTELSIIDDNDNTLVSFSTANAMCINSTDGKMTFSVPADIVENLLLTKGKYSIKVFKRLGSVISESGSWTSTTFDVDDGTRRGNITANGGTPFSAVTVGDYISIAITTSLADAFSGLYKVEEVSSTNILLATKLPGEDFTGSTDIAIYRLDKVNFYRLFEGTVEYSKESSKIPYAN